MLDIPARRRMRDTKRTVDTFAVFDLIIKPIVAIIAEISRTEAMIDSYRAAEVALPVNLLSSMFLTCADANSVCFDLTVLATKSILLHRLFHAKLSLTVDEAPKVWLIAVIALIEGARVHGKLQKLAVIRATSGCEASRIRNSLVFSNFESRGLNLLANCSESFKLSGDLFASELLDLLLALRARHKCKRDLESIPAVLE